MSFINIEGNLGPEDCILSRQVITHPADDDDESFFDDFVERTRRSPTYSSALYAAGLPEKVRAGARPIFQSLVALSARGDLIPKFLSLSCPRLFIYGERNSSLSYLQALAAGGIELAAIPHSAHFPMYSNPVAMWERIGEFYTRNNLT